MWNFLSSKQCILAESRFDFLKDLVLSIPDVQTEGDEGAASVPNTPVGLQPPPLFRSQLSNNEEGASSSSRGARRPRGRPRKTPVAVQRYDLKFDVFLLTYSSLLT